MSGEGLAGVLRGRTDRRLPPCLSTLSCVRRNGGQASRPLTAHQGLPDQHGRRAPCLPAGAVWLRGQHHDQQCHQRPRIQRERRGPHLGGQRPDHRAAPGAGAVLPLADRRRDGSQDVHARRQEASGPGDSGGQERPERPAGPALHSGQVGAEYRDHRARTARDDPGGHRFRRDEPDGRVRRLRHHHRPPLRLLRYVGPGPGGLAGGDLGRRLGFGVRVRDDHQGARAGGWCAARPRPAERGRQDPVRRQRGESAPAHERGPGPDDAQHGRWVRQPRELAGLPAVPDHGEQDPGQHGRHRAGEGRCLSVGLAGGSGRHGEGPARHR